MVDQQSATCFNCHTLIFRLFSYKDVNVTDLYVHVGIEIYTNLFLLFHISCNELKKLVAGTKTQEFSLRMVCIELISVKLCFWIILSGSGASFKLLSLVWMDIWSKHVAAC